MNLASTIKKFYFFLLITIILALMALLPGSVWEGDEYFQMGRMLHGMSSLGDYIRERIIWSPRPLSEMILVGYYEICALTERAHAGVLNIILWVAFFAITGVAARWSIRLMIIPLTLFVVMALWGAPYEIFYWPAGAAPYLLTCAFVVALLLTCLRQSSRVDNVLQVLFLTGCALSSEVGMLFTAFWVGLMIVRRILERDLFRAQSVAPLILPTLSVGVVAFLSLHGRMIYENIPHAHRDVSSLLRETFSTEISSLLKGPFFTQNLFNHSFTSNILVYIFLTLGFFLLFRIMPPHTFTERKSLGIIIGSCLLAQITTIWISLSQYGFLTDRHGDVRLMLTLVALVSLGALLASWSHSVTTQKKDAAFIPLTLAIAMMLPTFIPAWQATHRILPEILRDKELTWQSGLASGDSMMFICAGGSPLLITCPNGINAGTYRVGQPNLNWIYTGIMVLFEKKSITVLQP